MSSLVIPSVVSGLMRKNVTMAEKTASPEPTQKGPVLPRVEEDPPKSNRRVSTL